MTRPPLQTPADSFIRFSLDNYSWLLISSALLLLAAGPLSNIPLGCMALIGVYRVIKRPSMLYRDRPCLFILLLFLCLWLPQFIALFDAVNMERSLRTVMSRSLYLFCGVFMVQELMKGENLRKVSMAFFLIGSFWCIDALIQYGAGANLLGYPAVDAALSGMFYPKIRLGLILAVLTPLSLEVFRRMYKDRGFPWLMLIPFALVILLSGRRSAWIMLAVGLLAYIPLIFPSLSRQAKYTILASVLAAALGVGYVYLNDQGIQRRMASLSGLFAGGEQTEIATSRRTAVWDTAWEMFRRHWFNGIGPRGFRYVYRHYADVDNFFIQEGREGTTHPHLFFLEIAVETGVLGIMGFVIFYFIVLRCGWRGRDNTALAAWTAALLAAAFPLNAHMAFYGSYWSGFMWLLIAGTIAAVMLDEKGGLKD